MNKDSQNHLPQGILHKMKAEEGLTAGSGVAPCIEEGRAEGVGWFWEVSQVVGFSFSSRQGRYLNSLFTCCKTFLSCSV